MLLLRLTPRAACFLNVSVCVKARVHPATATLAQLRRVSLRQCFVKIVKAAVDKTKKLVMASVGFDGNCALQDLVKFH
jgi:hypothetical protein